MIVELFGIARIRRTLLWCGLALALLCSQASAAPAAQSPDTTHHFELNDIALDMPSDWDLDSSISPPQKVQLRISRQKGLHDESLMILDAPTTPSLTPEEMATKYFADKQNPDAAAGVFSDFKTETRTTGGVARPALSWRYTPTSGTPLTDEAVLLHFPADYVQRQRFYVFYWMDTHSATVPADDLSQLDLAVAATSLRRLGTVLAEDDFQDPTAGLLPNESHDPDHYLHGYADSEYFLRTTDPSWPYPALAGLPRPFADTTFGVDAYFASDAPAQLMELMCRYNSISNAVSGYVLMVSPTYGVRLARLDSGEYRALTDWVSTSSAYSSDDPAHIELSCAGDVLSGSLNGTRLLRVSDATYQQGYLTIAAGAAGATVDARLLHLVVTQQ